MRHRFCSQSATHQRHRLFKLMACQSSGSSQAKSHTLECKHNGVRWQRSPCLVYERFIVVCVLGVTELTYQALRVDWSGGATMHWMWLTVYERKIILLCANTECVYDDILACPRNLEGCLFQDVARTEETLRADQRSCGRRLYQGRNSFLSRTSWCEYLKHWLGIPWTDSCRICGIALHNEFNCPAWHWR